MMGEAQRFFDEYARAASGSDPQDLAMFYDDSVVLTGPSGTRSFRNDARYRAWLLGTLEANRDAGLVELTPKGVGSYDLGPALLLATVQWSALFVRAERPLEFTKTYLLRRAPDGLRIVCAAAHDDPEAEMRRLGVLPEPRPRAGTKRVRRQAAQTPPAHPAAPATHPAQASAHLARKRDLTAEDEAQ